MAETKNSIKILHEMRERALAEHDTRAFETLTRAINALIIADDLELNEMADYFAKTLRGDFH
jgi:hypothetical protein